jgi:hypothetical protein
MYRTHKDSIRRQSHKKHKLVFDRNYTQTPEEDRIMKEAFEKTGKTVILKLETLPAEQFSVQRISARFMATKIFPSPLATVMRNAHASQAHTEINNKDKFWQDFEHELEEGKTTPAVRLLVGDDCQTTTQTTGGRTHTRRPNMQPDKRTNIRYVTHDLWRR